VTLRQCKTCPWRVGVDPARDIPGGYSVELHHSLRRTIAEPGVIDLGGFLEAMACHYSPLGEEFACAGWVHNQLGPGNNLALRIAVRRGQVPAPIVDGPQRESFDDTLPRG
jgi:hypothetical protein